MELMIFLAIIKWTTMAGLSPIYEEQSLYSSMLYWLTLWDDEKWNVPRESLKSECYILIKIFKANAN